MPQLVNGREKRIVFENPLVIALRDAFPVNRGHTLIVPRRHVPTWFDASAEERMALMAAVDEARGGVRWVIPARERNKPLIGMLEEEKERCLLVRSKPYKDKVYRHHYLKFRQGKKSVSLHSAFPVRLPRCALRS